MRSRLRRVLAALTLLSVLPGTLGWGHPGCARELDGAERAARTATGSSHVPRDEWQASATRDASRRANAPGVHRECGDSHAGRGATSPDASHRGGRSDGTVPRGTCAIVAHCVIAAPPAPVVALAQAGLLVEQPRDARDSLPPAPTREPDSPPPRA